MCFVLQITFWGQWLGGLDMTDETCKSLLGTEVREGLYMMGKIDGMGVGWVDIAHGGKSLHIAFGDIDAVMFEGFQEG